MWKPGDRIFEPMFCHLQNICDKPRLCPKNRVGHRRRLFPSRILSNRGPESEMSGTMGYCHNAAVRKRTVLLTSILIRQSHCSECHDVWRQQEVTPRNTIIKTSYFVLIPVVTCLGLNVKYAQLTSSQRQWTLLVSYPSCRMEKSQNCWLDFR
jgi:hypothetical protein